MRTPMLLLTVLAAAGCANTNQTTEPVIWAGAMQDENYEIKGKPETGGGAMAGYNSAGGEVNPQSLEEQAIGSPQVHYHYHTHNHHHPGGSYSIAGAPHVTTSFNGYAHPAYMVPHHPAMQNPASPYANNPNGGNAANPYTSGWQGGNPYYNHGGNWAPGEFNPWANNGTGSIEE
ncbi:MAG: hypothetical protein CMJ22_00670 [Phycisphaerae bacterium]|nr:hypothetical protein [Phycisphaerae bacterium]MCP4794617.1 hypothetical protein [Phycisphaeraceae bacterium]